MRITKLTLPAETYDSDGLKSITMTKLKPIVLLVGKNGAGKSRLLNKMFAYVGNNGWTEKSKEDVKKKIGEIQNNIQNHESAIRQTQSQISSATGESKASLEEQLKRYQESKTSLQSQLSSHCRTLEIWERVEFSELRREATKPIHFTLSDYNLQDPNNFNKNDLYARANALNELGTTHVQQNVFARIQVVQDQWINAKHNIDSANFSEVERKKMIDDYERLKRYIHDFLGTELTRSKENDACLFGRRLGDTQLSQGQRALLMFCLAIYAQAAQLQDLIIIIDEPENHLHPAAGIEVIEKISQHVTNGQLWIATHSVPLLGHFVDNENAQMWYVEDGGVEYLGKKSEKVLHGLLGDAEEQARMRSFLDLPAQQAFDTFCYQCLFEPDVVMTNSKDPQTKQIYDIIHERIKTGESVRVLDFGAGKGRLLAAIHALWDKTDVELKQFLDYIAYDVTDDSSNAEYQARRNSCCEVLDAVYGTSEERYFNDKEALKTSKDHHSFDIVILCNVFHEIPPEDWLKEFDGKSLIYTMLQPDGHLVIVEDQHLAVGETAHKYGFLVFDKPQFRTLFAMKEKDQYEVRDASSKKNGRLQAHIIPAEYLPRITSDTQKDALKSLAAVSEKKISELRLKAKDYSSGKLYAFWVQQYANAKLALEP